jgi:putative transposase
MAISFKGAHFPPEVILVGVRWYVAYPLSTRHVEELMLERGVHVDHSTVSRWVIKYSPPLEEAFHRRKRPVWLSWRMDETYIKVKGEWRYLYRAVDKYGATIDFLLTKHRDTAAALWFLKKAIRRNGVPETITIDGSDAHEAAIKSYNQEHGTAIAIRQVKYLNNIVEQDHRAVKRVTRPMLGFKSFHAARRTLVGIERMHMMKKTQGVGAEGNDAPRAAEQCSSLAVEAPHRQGQPALASPLSTMCDGTQPHPCQAGRRRDTLSRARGEPAVGCAAGGPHPQHPRERPTGLSSPFGMPSPFFGP